MAADFSQGASPPVRLAIVRESATPIGWSPPVISEACADSVEVALPASEPAGVLVGFRPRDSYQDHVGSVLRDSSADQSVPTIPAMLHGDGDLVDAVDEGTPEPPDSIGSGAGERGVVLASSYGPAGRYEPVTVVGQPNRSLAPSSEFEVTQR